MKRHRDGDNGPAAKAALIEVILSKQADAKVYNNGDFLRRLSTAIQDRSNAGENCDFSRSLPHPQYWEEAAYFLRTGEVKETNKRTDIPRVLANAVFLGLTKMVNAVKTRMNDPSFCQQFSSQLSTEGTSGISAEVMLQLVDNRPLSKNSKLTPIGGIVKAWGANANGAASSLLAHALSEIEVISENCYLKVKGSEKSGVDGTYELLPGLRNSRKAWKRTTDYTRDSGLTHFSNYMNCPPCIYWNQESSTWCLEWANPSYLASAKRTEGYFVQEDVQCPSLVTKCWTYKQKQEGKDTQKGTSKPTLIVSRLKQDEPGSCVIC